MYWYGYANCLENGSSKRFLEENVKDYASPRGPWDAALIGRARADIRIILTGAD